MFGWAIISVSSLSPFYVHFCVLPTFVELARPSNSNPILWTSITLPTRHRQSPPISFHTSCTPVILDSQVESNTRNSKKRPTNKASAVYCQQQAIIISTSSTIFPTSHPYFTSTKICPKNDFSHFHLVLAPFLSFHPLKNFIISLHSLFTIPSRRHPFFINQSPHKQH